MRKLVLLLLVATFAMYAPSCKKEASKPETVKIKPSPEVQALQPVPFPPGSHWYSIETLGDNYVWCWEAYLTGNGTEVGARIVDCSYCQGLPGGPCGPHSE